MDSQQSPSIAGALRSPFYRGTLLWGLRHLGQQNDAQGFFSSC